MATDQEIRDAGLLYIPKQKYLQNPYQLPIAPVPPAASGGITNIASPRTINNGGNDNFSVYNPDPNSIVNKNYNPYTFRNAAENSFLPGGSNATDQIFNPKSTTDLNVIRARNLYNLSSNALAGRPSTMKLNNMGTSMKDMSPGELEFLKTANNNFIQDNRQNYGANTQYEKDNYYDTVDSPLAYNSQTELDKFKDNYPGYFEPKPLEGIPGAIKNYVQGSFPGRMITKATSAINSILPLQRRGIMENELGGQGIMVDDIGRIVQGKGNYNTPQNIMAGYAATVGMDTVNKRKANINKSLGKYEKYDPTSSKFDQDKYDQMQDKLKALDEFAEIRGLVDEKTDTIFDYKKKQRKKKKNIFDIFKTKKTTEAADAKDAKDAKDALKFKKEKDRLAGLIDTRGTDPNTGTSSLIQNESGGNTRDTSRASDHGSVGLGHNAGNVREAMAERAANPESKRGSAQSYNQNLARGGRAGYFFGGRVNYKIGGRVGFKNGGLASIL